MTKEEKTTFEKFKLLLRGYSYLRFLCQGCCSDGVSWCESKIVILSEYYVDFVSDCSVSFPASQFKRDLFSFINRLSRRDVGLDFEEIRTNFIIRDIENYVV